MANKIITQPQNNRYAKEWERIFGKKKIEKKAKRKVHKCYRCGLNVELICNDVDKSWFIQCKGIGCQMFYGLLGYSLYNEKMPLGFGDKKTLILDWNKKINW